MSKIKYQVDKAVQYFLNRNWGSSENVYQVFDELEMTSIEQLENPSVQTYEEQVEWIRQPSLKDWNYWIYKLTSFLKPLYVFTAKDYITGEEIKGTVRASNTVDAKAIAKRFYNLPSDPEKIERVVASKLKPMTKVLVNPTFSKGKKVPKMQLWQFLVEYSSLMEDGLTKAQAVQILKMDMIKDKRLIEFMDLLKTSNYKMSTLMEQIWYFDDYTISIISSSEQAWWETQLYKGLTELGLSYIAEEEFRKKFINSLIYPGFMIFLVICIALVGLFVLVPILAGLFSEIVGESKLPPLITNLLAFKESLLDNTVMIALYILWFLIVRKILLSNSYISWQWQQFKLRLPLLGNITRISEENRIFRILVQTHTSTLSEVQKIQAFEKATSNLLYKWVYRTMRNTFPLKRNFTKTVEDVNERFGWQIFGLRMLTVLNLAVGDSKKVLSKYESFLKKNTELLYQKFTVVNKIVTTIALILVAWSVVTIFGTLISAMSSIIWWGG